LMEEFFHLRLNHPRSVIRVFAASEGARTHDGAVEAAAYGSGAAALLPYAALKRLLADGTSTATIARRFGVSGELVAYRMKVTKLYSQHRRRSVR
jgi:Zn-dependent peptidase ImmA (M78 family)